MDIIRGEKKEHRVAAINTAGKKQWQ